MRFALFVLVIGLGCFIGGLFVGRSFRSGAPSADPSASTDEQVGYDRPESQRVRCALTIDPAMLRTELAKALAERGPLAIPAAPPTVVPTESPTSPNPAQFAARDQAQAAIDKILGAGRATAEESHQLRALLGILDEDSRHQLTLRIVGAINQDRLVFENNEFPF